MNATTYKPGDMQRTRWKLAMQRWMANQQKRPTLKNVQPQIVTKHSMQAIEDCKAQGTKSDFVAPNAESAIMPAENELQAVDVDDIVSPSTPSTNCVFCGRPYQPPNARAMYCSGTCKQDAYLVRKAFADGRAARYLASLEPGISPLYAYQNGGAS